MNCKCYVCGCFRFVIRFAISIISKPIPALCTSKPGIFSEKNCVFSILFFFQYIFFLIFFFIFRPFSPAFTVICSLYFLHFIFSVFMFCSSISLESTYEKKVFAYNAGLRCQPGWKVWQVGIIQDIEHKDLWDGLSSLGLLICFWCTLINESIHKHTSPIESHLSLYARESFLFSSIFSLISICFTVARWQCTSHATDKITSIKEKDVKCIHDRGVTQMYYVCIIEFLVKFSKHPFNSRNPKEDPLIALSINNNNR